MPRRIEFKEGGIGFPYTLLHRFWTADNNNNKGSRSNVNKHELENGESSFNARYARCLFIICVIVYNLYYCCYAKTSSSAVPKRHSKVYGKPIPPSLYSISPWFFLVWGWVGLVLCK